MKIVGIDGNEANVKNRLGVNVYAFETLWAIYRLQDEWKEDFKFVIFLGEKPLADLPKEIKKTWEYQVIPGKTLWILTKLTPYLLFSQKKPHLLFSPSHYTVPIAVMPRICSIMDLGYLKFSEQFNKLTFWQLKYWTAISIFVSKHIIAISNATKKDIVRHYPFTLKKVSVTYLGYDRKRFNKDISEKDVRRIKKKYSIVDDYILFLGTLKPSKNLEGIIQAYSSILNSQFSISKVKLVIAGKKGWLYDLIFKKVKDLGLEKDIIFTGFVPEEDKPALLKGAKLFLSPSFSEGFGLNVLEALACGTPCIVSNLGSLPEVVGKAGVFVNPYSPVSIEKGIKRILKLPKKDYNKLVYDSLFQAKKFSWQKTAQETLALFRKII